jgi:hypothetical protein
MSTDDLIDISKMDKAEVLAKLYNAARPMGMGMLQARPGDLSIEDARRLLDDPEPKNDMGFSRAEGYFDYLYGRPLKIDLRGDQLHTRLYDRDHGQGAAARALGVGQ